MPAHLSVDGERVQLLLLANQTPNPNDPQQQQQQQQALATCEFHLHGATCTSWRVLSKSKSELEERLFLSRLAAVGGAPQPSETAQPAQSQSHSTFSPPTRPSPNQAAPTQPTARKAIRGGIPLVFPQFGTGPRSPRVQHGFARIHSWRWLGIERERAGEELVAAFSLSHVDLAANHAWAECWPHQFRLIYRVHLTPRTLRTELVVRNDNNVSTAFQFTALMHTYFRVVTVPGDEGQGLNGMRVRGLRGVQYQDKLVKSDQIRVEESDALRIESEVDRVYLNVNGPVTIDQQQVPGGLSTRVEMVGGFRDVVLWNPWVDKAKAMADFGDEEYWSMVCVEPGAVGTEVELQPGEEWMGGQLLTALPDRT